MPLKGLLSRPSTSMSNKRHSSIEPSQPVYKSTKSSERGHRKLGSLHRLSLSFTSSRDGATFQELLTDEPRELRPRTDSIPQRPSSSHLMTSTAQAVESANTESTPMPSTQAEQDEANVKEIAPKPQRFSLMKFRHASEPQLSTRYKEKEPTAEPVPKIITTAPTQHHDAEVGRKSKEGFFPRTFSTFRKSQVFRQEVPFRKGILVPGQVAESTGRSMPNLTRAHSDNVRWVDGQNQGPINAPPAYDDESNSTLALPLTRLSESSRSEGSSNSHKLYAETTTTHFIETTTTIFKLKRNKKKTKDKGPLFPLPEKPPSSASRRTSISQNIDAEIERESASPSRKSTQGSKWRSRLDRRDTEEVSPSSSVTALTNAPLGSPGPAIARKHSTLSAHSGNSTPTGTLIPPRLGARGRSSTLGSLGKSVERLADLHTAPSSTRNSTSTAGRRSFGDILTQRLRQNSGPPRHGSSRSGSTPGSKSNSFQIAREAEPELAYPRREEEDTPASYLEKLEAAVPKGVMATILCKGADDFSKTCLRKYMRGFAYFGESIDMSIRKMLMEVVLPKETQQIDRLLAGFADRYHECNPGIFMNADEANFVAFSILLLQSDNHNKNNKRKMTKQDYVKNTQNGRISVAEDILECFYDNICYTPFIHFEDDVAVNSHRLAAPRRRTGGLIRSKSQETLRGPVDPYTLILDNKLDSLRPSLKGSIETEDTYGTDVSTSLASANDNHRAFVHAAVLQIVSARSRPDAFRNQATITNPAEAQAGLVSIKVAKVGLLWRKSMKKKKAKSPWQEWGVVLTDSKLYFFRDVGWAKKLISQYEGYPKTSTRNTPLVFKPPLTSFDPDALMSIEDAVALTDSSYKRHKNAFTFIKHGGFEEVFLANAEADVADWISKLNYAATFRTAGVRMRGLLGVNYEGRNMYRKNSEISITTSDSHPSDVPTPIDGKTNPQLAWEIMFYRRQLVSEKISSFDDHVAAAQRELDYLQRNARHLLLLLPIQQKSREAIVYAAGRMNAKLNWTKKEIWRARTHRDILIKDLEAEATTAFPASGHVQSRGSTTNTTPLKVTPTKVSQSGVSRSDTNQTIHSNRTKSPLAMVQSPVPGKPSQAVSEQMRPDTSTTPELGTRRRSAGSHRAMSPRVSDRTADDQASDMGTPVLHTQPSQHMSIIEHQPSADTENEEKLLKDAGLLHVDESKEKHWRHESDADKEHRHGLPQPHEGSLKDRTGSVRRSLHRTLRESGQHVHIPTHSRGKKGRESGSSIAMTEDGVRSIMSHESEELKRDPTGRFVLHGKKASVITMSPDWQLSSEDRIRMREQAVSETSEPGKINLHIDTNVIDAARKNVYDVGIEPKEDDSSAVEEVSPEAEVEETDGPVFGRRQDTRDSNNFSIYSAVTTPAGTGEIFHSAESSPRVFRSKEEESEAGSEDEAGFEDESTFVKDGVNGTPGKTLDEDKGGASGDGKRRSLYQEVIAA